MSNYKSVQERLNLSGLASQRDVIEALLSRIEKLEEAKND